MHTSEAQLIDTKAMFDNLQDIVHRAQVRDFLNSPHNVLFQPGTQHVFDNEEVKELIQMGGAGLYTLPLLQSINKENKRCISSLQELVAPLQQGNAQIMHAKRLESELRDCALILAGRDTLPPPAPQHSPTPASSSASTTTTTSTSTLFKASSQPHEGTEASALSPAPQHPAPGLPAASEPAPPTQPAEARPIEEAPGPSTAFTGSLLTQAAAAAMHREDLHWLAAQAGGATALLAFLRILLLEQRATFASVESLGVAVRSGYMEVVECKAELLRLLNSPACPVAPRHREPQPQGGGGSGGGSEDGDEPPRVVYTMDDAHMVAEETGTCGLLMHYVRKLCAKGARYFSLDQLVASVKGLHMVACAAGSNDMPDLAPGQGRSPGAGAPGRAAAGSHLSRAIAGAATMDRHKRTVMAYSRSSAALVGGARDSDDGKGARKGSRGGGAAAASGKGKGKSKDKDKDKSMKSSLSAASLKDGSTPLESNAPSVSGLGTSVSSDPPASSLQGGSPQSLLPLRKALSEFASMKHREAAVLSDYDAQRRAMRERYESASDASNEELKRTRAEILRKQARAILGLPPALGTS
jgi:hypothetical protein